MMIADTSIDAIPAVAEIRARVLIVDDSPSFRKMVSFVLKEGGCEVIEASDANQAITSMERAEFDVVLADHHLPGTDGVMLIAQIRSRTASSSIPIVMLTTETSEDMKAAARAAGATAWMAKPFEPGRLLALIEQVVV
ncbi:MAG: response regulator [Pseudomonadota bacterium]|nr:response regulator [Pseudomonadota bacterium]